MENLHLDIKLNILSRLPVESVNQCKLVSKRWRDLLRHNKMGLLFCIAVEDTYHDPIQFYYTDQYDDEINMDDDHYYHNSYKTLTKMNHPPIATHERSFLDAMSSSCNGLVCLFVSHHAMNDPIYICNPVTCEYVYLPRFTIPTNRTSENHDMVGGFGYNHSTNEYKVVRIYYDFDQCPTGGKVQVYTLGSGNGWRNKGNVANLFAFRSVFANGVIHFIDTLKRKIVAFDLADEEFRVLPYPPSLETPGSKSVALLCLRGYLCLVHSDRDKCMDIWVYKKENSRYEVNEQNYASSWSKEFSIPWEGLLKGTYYEPFAITKSNQVLLYYDGMVSCYDHKTGTLKELWENEGGMRYIEAIPHMNSLVSLKALGEKSETRKCY